MLNGVGVIAGHGQLELGIGRAFQNVFFQNIPEQRTDLDVFNVKVDAALRRIGLHIEIAFAGYLALIHRQFQWVEVENTIFGTDLNQQIIDFGLVGDQLPDFNSAL